MGTLLEQDKYRYAVEKMPRFQRLFRCCQECRFKPMQLVYRLLFRWCRQRNFIELSHQTVIGGGLYIGHPYCITINPQAVIGRNVNIHRGVVIGQENRGKRKGAPTLGDDNQCVNSGRSEGRERRNDCSWGLCESRRAKSLGSYWQSLHYQA